MGKCKGAKMQCNCPMCKGVRMVENDMAKGASMKGAYMDKGAYMAVPFTKKFCKGY